MPRQHFACQPTDADRRWSVIGFKLQKHESSFKHLLFTAFAKMWRGAVKRARGMLFPPPPKDAGKSSRDFTEGPQTAKSIWLLRKPDLNELTAVSNILLCFSWTIWEKNKARFFCLSTAECVFYSPCLPLHPTITAAKPTWHFQEKTSTQFKNTVHHNCCFISFCFFCFISLITNIPFIQFWFSPYLFYTFMSQNWTANHQKHLWWLQPMFLMHLQS